MTVDRREFLVGTAIASAVWPVLARQTEDDPAAATAALRAAVPLASRADPLVRRVGLFGPPPPVAPIEPRIERVTAWALRQARFDLGIFRGDVP